jgi:hypothetical protein
MQAKMRRDLQHISVCGKDEHQCCEFHQLQPLWKEIEQQHCQAVGDPTIEDPIQALLWQTPQVIPSKLHQLGCTIRISGSSALWILTDLDQVDFSVNANSDAIRGASSSSLNVKPSNGATM